MVYSATEMEQSCHAECVLDWEESYNYWTVLTLVDVFFFMNISLDNTCNHKTPQDPEWHPMCCRTLNILQPTRSHHHSPPSHNPPKGGSVSNFKRLVVSVELRSIVQADKDNHHYVILQRIMFYDYHNGLISLINFYMDFVAWTVQ